MARLYDRLQVIEFAGLDLAVCERELYESAVVMGRQALMKLGVSQREAERVEREYRERDLDRLDAQTRPATSTPSLIEASVSIVLLESRPKTPA